MDAVRYWKQKNLIYAWIPRVVEGGQPDDNRTGPIQVAVWVYLCWATDHRRVVRLDRPRLNNEAIVESVDLVIFQILVEVVGVERLSQVVVEHS